MVAGETDESTAPSTADVHRAEVAVYVAFIGAGFAFASWAGRIPQVRDRLDVTPGALGLILLSVAVGSLISLPATGVIVTRLGARRAVAASVLILAGGWWSVHDERGALYAPAEPETRPTP